MKAKNLSSDAIEFEVQSLTNGFQAKYGTILGRKIPIDEIAQNYLGLRIEYTQLGRNELGRLLVSSRRVQISDVLDPTNPKTEGRHNFTMAHEIGHEVLHAPAMRKDENQYELLNDRDDSKIIVCRDGSTATIEWQADKFSSTLLLPKVKVAETWREFNGTYSKIDESELADMLRNDENACRYVGSFRQKQDKDYDKALIEYYFRPLAQNHAVSAPAFCHRLRTLGLLGVTGQLLEGAP